MLATGTLSSAYEKAETLLAAGELRQAADLCKKILDEDPAYPYGYHLMGALFRAVGTYDKALAFSHMAVCMAPEIAAFHLQQGRVLLTLGDGATAAASFEKAHLLEPANPLPVLLWADACVRMGDFAKADGLFMRARAIRDTPEADEHEGLSLLTQEKLPEAERLFDKLIARRPDYDAGHVHKARLLMMRKQYPEAEASFARALRYNPRSYDALHGMALINDRQGQTELAIFYAMQAINAGPLAPENHCLLGWLLFKQHHYEAAGPVLQQAHAMDPDNAYIFQLLLDCYARQDKPAEALAQAEKLLSLSSQHPLPRFFCDMLSRVHPACAPAAYAISYYNHYAERFDHDMQHVHAYKVPQLVAATVRSLMGTLSMRTARLLDLGCGTGLCALALQDIASDSVGIDLADKMLRKARARHIYAHLHQCDMIDYLRSTDRTFDIVLAANSLTTIGDLAPFFQAARQAMASRGWIVITIEKSMSAARDFTLQPSGRYTHSASYVRSLAASEGYDMVREEEVILRVEDYTPVQGYVFALKKTQVH